jgi:hypothetical protein
MPYTDLGPAEQKTFSEAFDNTLDQLAQQQESLLASAAKLTPVFTGQSKTVDYAAPRKMREVTDRYGLIQYSPQQYVRRVLTLHTKEDADLVPLQDLQKQLYDPQSTIMQQMINGQNREQDATIYEALGGQSLSASSDGSPSEFIELPTSQIIVNGSTGLTKAKMTQALRMLQTAHHGRKDGGELYLVISAYQMQDLLNDDTLTNTDYATVGSIADGEITGSKLWGFNLVQYEDIAMDSNDVFQCFAWDKNAVTYTLRGEVRRVSIESQRRYSPQVYNQVSLGAVRTAEDGVVRIDCSASGV